MGNEETEEWRDGRMGGQENREMKMDGWRD